MSTVTRIQRYRRARYLVPTSPLAPNSQIRELWGDTVATVAVVSLAAFLLSQVFRLVVQ